jgi:hypothetical protein
MGRVTLIWMRNVERLPGEIHANGRPRLGALKSIRIVLFVLLSAVLGAV